MKNREIKFRAWDSISTCYHYWRGIEHLPLKEFIELEHYTLEQCIGIKDKNGRYIYEGDIVSYYQPYAKRTDIHVVKWDDEWAGFGLFERDNIWCKESDWVKIMHIDVVGNIHANPELLK
tara:strand:- start:335 stop:694 length:360 start_codon:yes stop_codon:yes gene_type:complete